MPQQNPTLLDLMRDDYADLLTQADDTQRDARLAIINHFVAYGNQQLARIGFSQLRHSAGGYIGQLVDGRNFAITPEETTPENSTGEMEPSNYAQIGGGGLSPEEIARRQTEEMQMLQGVQDISQ